MCFRVLVFLFILVSVARGDSTFTYPSEPVSLAVDAANSVFYVSFFLNGGGGAVRKYDFNNNQQASWTSGLSSAPSIALSSDGNTLYAGVGSSLNILSTASMTVTKTVSETMSLDEIAVGPNGNIFVASGTSTVAVLDSNGNKLSSSTSNSAFPQRMYDLSVDSDSNMYIGTKKYSSSGQELTTYGAGQTWQSNAFCPSTVDFQGNVSVFVYTNAPNVNYIYTYNNGGSLTASLQVNTVSGESTALVIDTQGTLWIVDDLGQKIVTKSGFAVSTGPATNNNAHSSSSLSSSQVAGVAVGASVGGCIVLGAIVAFLFMRYRNQQSASKQAQSEVKATPDATAVLVSGPQSAGSITVDASPATAASSEGFFGAAQSDVEGIEGQ